MSKWNAKPAEASGSENPKSDKSGGGAGRRKIAQAVVDPHAAPQGGGMQGGRRGGMQGGPQGGRRGGMQGGPQGGRRGGVQGGPQGGQGGGMPGGQGGVQAEMREAMSVARQAVQAGNYDEAQQAFEKILEDNPEFTQAYMGLGQMYLRLKEYEKALEYFDAALAIRPENVQALVMSGNIYQRMKNYDMALEKFQAALELNPEHEQAQVNVSRIYAEMDDVDAALVSIREALSRNPQSEHLRMTLSNLLQRSGDKKSAFDELENVAIHNPQSWQAHSRLCRMHLGEHHYDQALKECELAISNCEEPRASLFCDLGSCFTGLKQFDKAHQALDQALEADPKSKNARMGKVRVYIAESRYDEAKVLLHELSRGSRVPVNVHVLLADIMMHEGHYKLAVEQYNAALLKGEKLLDKHPELAEVKPVEGDEEATALAYKHAFDAIGLFQSDIEE